MLGCSIIYNLVHLPCANVPYLQRHFIFMFGKCCTCRWWRGWALLHTALNTSTGLCFGCSRQTLPVPGVHSAPRLVPSPYAGDRYGGPPSRA